MSNENNEEVKKPAEPEAVVQVAKADLDKLFSTLDRQSKDIEMLYKAADKARLATIQSQDNAKKTLIKTVKVWRWEDNGKLIVAWKLTSNVSEIVGRVWTEDQRVAVVFEDGESNDVSLIDFYRHRLPVVAEVVKKSSQVNDRGDEVITLNVQFPDGKELEIGQQFIN